MLNHGVSPTQAKKKTDKAFEHCFFSILKVFLNLTHNFGKFLESNVSNINFYLNAIITVLLIQLSLRPVVLLEEKKICLLIFQVKPGQLRGRAVTINLFKIPFLNTQVTIGG